MSETAATEHSDVLVIKVWREPDSEHPIRARLTYGPVTDEAPTTVVTTDPGEVLDTMRHWLTDVSTVD